MRIAFAFLALIAGFFAGRRLAARGITAQNALTGRQPLAYAILLGVAAVFATVYFAHRLTVLTVVPTALVIAAEEFVWPVVIAMASFALGLIVRLEWPGRRDVRRAASALGGAAVILVALAYLGWRSLPLTALLAESRVAQGVVMQTTSYTCAPSSIATLGRVSGLDTALTERTVVALAGTTREGSTTWRELHAMRALGMAPRFGRHLTAESLLVAGRPALLHVDEPIGSTTIRHAVALIAIDPVARTVTLGNPLSGRQVLRFDQLRGYWGGEALFVTTGRGLQP